MADYAFLTTWLLDSPREPVWEAIYDQERWPEWWRGVEEVEEKNGGGGGGVGAGARGGWKRLLPYRGEVGGVRADGRQELAPLPGRVRGDDHPRRAAVPAAGRRGRRAIRHRPLAALRAGRHHRCPLRGEGGADKHGEE